MATRRALVVPALVVLVAIVAVACSGGSDRLTKAQLARRASAICRDLNRRVGRIPSPDPDDPVATAAVLGRRLDAQRGALRRLRVLEPPEADAADYQRWLTQIGLALAQGEASRTAIAAENVQAAAAANQRGEEIRTDADRFATSYGMEACVRR